MRNWTVAVVGLVLVVVGVFWALQGFGTIGGSFMSNNSAFEIIGPVVAVIGLLLAIVGIRRARSA
ncbi:MAG TPA: hypothetical protein VEV63_10135 [Streptosporangiaceae bacterium]|nr:hypothetical protein [Streptosporangiaceae bacterium]